MSYRGHVKNGIVIFDESVDLPEGIEVRVEVLQPGTPLTPLPSSLGRGAEGEGGEPESGDGEAPTLYERLGSLFGAAQGLPADASTNVDHYLYGHPKR